VNKTIYSRQAECLRDTIIELRKEAGLNQRQLASKLGRVRSLVGRLEVGQRRLDLVEFYWLCKACNADPADLAKRLLRKFEEIENPDATDSKLAPGRSSGKQEQ
jgi:transcriptional regulator with XRE-family HTH domain